MSVFDSKVNFRDNLDEGVIEKVEEEVDFAQKMRNAVDVQLIDTNLYMSKELWLPWGSRGAFGGQATQALRAAWDTVEEDFAVHSLHAYFILACSVEIPVVYSIQRVRDGRSYATRIVTATQRGKAIFVSSCSFVKPDDSVALNHQTTMPETADPDTLPSDIEVLQNTLAITESIPEAVKQRAQKKLEDNLPVDSRAVLTLSPQQVITGSRRWFKTRGLLNDDMRLHACIIAYASDSGFITTAAAANGYLINSRSLGMIASLDHSIWFHTPARADKWLLYDVHSPRTNSGRGMVFGKIYSQDGTLVATTAQEGIIRLSEREQEKRRKKADATWQDDAKVSTASKL
ncbi:HotDog domain-containing protein [Mucor lusitanicus]|uniref:HotDog domain-containing protein n=1 Tax=Mucor circinelloides f. lusitanicus TaxID=29924 RepID=A0A8H4EYM6_MUCCL|nr:HotDog domain-containing protein [Mucor lusitanicus]